jgi:hypothetical protein
MKITLVFPITQLKSPKHNHFKVRFIFMSTHCEVRFSWFFLQSPSHTLLHYVLIFCQRTSVLTEHLNKVHHVLNVTVE